MAGRLEINFRSVRDLLHEPGIVEETQRVARRIDARASAESQTRYDFEHGRNRPRAAVIAGYEHGATTEHTRSVLLRALDA